MPCSRKRKGSRHQRRIRESSTSSSSSSEISEHTSSRSRSSSKKQKGSRQRRRTREPSTASSSSSETPEQSSSRSRSSGKKQKGSRQRRRTREPSTASSSSSETSEHTSSRSRSSSKKQKGSRQRRRTREPSTASSSSSETPEQSSSRNKSSGQKRKRRSTKRRRKHVNTTKRQQDLVTSDSDDNGCSVKKVMLLMNMNMKSKQVKNFLKCSHKHDVERDQSTPAKKPRHNESETIPEKDNPEWTCGNCTLTFTTWSDLRVHVCQYKKDRWYCGECGNSYSNKGNLHKHVKNKHSVESPKEAAVSKETDVMKEKQNISNKSPKESALPEKTGVMKENSKLILKVPVTKYKCKCGKTENTYDASVRHAQEHLVQLEALRKNGTQCELKFDNRDDGDYNNRSLIKTEFDYRKLLTKSWFDMFKRTELSLSIISSSLYKHTRSVKLNWDSDKRYDGEGLCVPLYKCGACNLFVEPTKVQKHCENYGACVVLEPQGHRCPECQKSFYTLKALKRHKKDHEAHKILRFRIVTFNYESDVQFNKALKQMSLVTVEDTPTKEQQEISRNLETQHKKNDNVQHTSQDNVAKPVLQYCGQCKLFYSDSIKHSAYHENKRKIAMDAVLIEKQLSLSADTAESAAKNNNNENAEKEVEEEENVSRNENTRTDSDVTGSTVQAHDEYTAEASANSKSFVMEWGDSDSGPDDSKPQKNLKANYFRRIVTKQDEMMQKTLDHSKLHGNRKNNNDVVQKGKVGEDDQYDQCESTLGRLLGESNNPINTLEEYNESQSMEDLQRLLEDDTESGPALTLQAPYASHSFDALWLWPRCHS